MRCRVFSAKDCPEGEALPEANTWDIIWKIAPPEKQIHSIKCNLINTNWPLKPTFERKWGEPQENLLLGFAEGPAMEDEEDRKRMAEEKKKAEEEEAKKKAEEEEKKKQEGEKKEGE